MRNPIDAFILARLEEQSLTPAPRASRRVLARRVYLNLIGLPPTPEEMRAVLDDTAPNAYEKVIDRLLGNPRLGERLAVQGAPIRWKALDPTFGRPNAVGVTRQRGPRGAGRGGVEDSGRSGRADGDEAVTAALPAPVSLRRAPDQPLRHEVHDHLLLLAEVLGLAR